MNEHDKRVIWAAAAVATVLLLALGLTLSWPAWVWVPLCVLITPAAMLVDREWDRRNQPLVVEPAKEESAQQTQFLDPPPTEAAPEVTAIVSHPIPSSLADYRFLVSARVSFRPDEHLHSDHLGNLDVLARDAIRHHATEFLRTRLPDEHDCLDDQLGAVLSTGYSVPGRLKTVWATEVTVELPEDDKERLTALARVRKNRDVWAHERERERNVREYLSTDVFTDPGRAVVWWLARALDSGDRGQREVQLDALLKEVPVLCSLTAAAHHKDIPQWTDKLADVLDASFATSPDPTSTEPLLLRFFHDAADGMTTDQRDLFAEQFSQLLRAHDQHDAADTLRQRFDGTTAFDDAPEVEDAQDQSHTEPDGTPDTSDSDEASMPSA